MGEGVRRLIEQECSELCSMLLEKNRAYGNSALEPIRLFSRASAEEQLLVRIDDKLSRLARGAQAGEDVVLDLLGYLVLLRVARRMGTDEGRAETSHAPSQQGRNELYDELCTGYDARRELIVGGFDRSGSLESAQWGEYVWAPSVDDDMVAASENSGVFEDVERPDVERPDVEQPNEEPADQDISARLGVFSYFASRSID